MDNNTARTAAQSMVDGRIVINTKNKYQSCINRLRKWYELHGKLFILPLQMEDVMTYFGSLIIPDPNKEKPPAFSSVQLHKSALVWYYKQQQIVIDPYIEQGKLFSELNKEQCNEIFKQAFGELTKQLYPTETNTRSGELSIATIYDRLCTRNNNNKRKHDEIEEKQLLANNMEL
jgi:hypothetical protein